MFKKLACVNPKYANPNYVNPKVLDNLLSSSKKRLASRGNF